MSITPATMMTKVLEVANRIDKNVSTSPEADTSAALVVIAAELQNIREVLVSIAGKMDRSAE